MTADLTPDQHSAPRTTFALVATLVIWGALAGAHGELAARALLMVKTPVLPSSFHFNPMALAVGPLVNVPIFAAAVLLVVLVARVLRPGRVFQAVVLVVLTLAAFEVALTTRRVHVAALFILAAGLASLVTRLVVRFPRGSLLVAKVTAVVMSLAAGIGGAWVSMRPSFDEARGLRALAAAPAGVPNVVVLILDTVRAIELGIYGNPRPVTPKIDSIARNAIRFDFAYSTAPWTLPSHTTMLTGRYPHEVSSDWSSPYDGAHPLLSEVLRDHGYATAAFVGNMVYLHRRWGLNRGFLRYEEYQLDQTVLATTSNLSALLVRWLNTGSRQRVRVKGADASTLRGRFGRWQRSLGERPFFAFINLFDAHAPYGAPAPFDTMFIGRRPGFSEIDDWSQRDSVENDELRTGYQQSLAWLDSQVGLLVDDLRQRGVLDRTLLVITSDHGEDFGEHGFSGHGGGLFATQTRVPLLVVPPGWRGARTVNEYVTLRDLAATIGEAASLREGTFPGTSLHRFWPPARPASSIPSPILTEVSRDPKLQSWYPASRGSLRSIVMDGLAYTRVLGDSTGEWLFDLVRDPMEQVDVAADPAYAGRLVSLRAAMDAAIAGTGSMDRPPR